ncbi:MAG: D-alanyl-D-alanine dipeptidase [Deltaproteobacteria bacterium]|nr:D-alanyl-D-alanine dipeptidase [Deltaproteobacteria bacterium]
MTDADDPLVDAQPLVPGLVVRLTYATASNLARRALYPPDMKCLLRRSVAERLAQAQRALARSQRTLVAWDCFRPKEAQEALWKALPVPGAVADPQKGSLHERGVAIDVGLLALDGSPVPLPTHHDEFNARTHADAPLPDGPAKQNRDLLIRALHDAGFRVNPKEWWHFSRLWGYRWPVGRLPRP